MWFVRRKSTEPANRSKKFRQPPKRKDLRLNVNAFDSLHEAVSFSYNWQIWIEFLPALNVSEKHAVRIRIYTCTISQRQQQKILRFVCDFKQPGFYFILLCINIYSVPPPLIDQRNNSCLLYKNFTFFTLSDMKMLSIYTHTHIHTETETNLLIRNFENYCRTRHLEKRRIFEGSIYF